MLRGEHATGCGTQVAAMRKIREVTETTFPLLEAAALTRGRASRPARRTGAISDERQSHDSEQRSDHRTNRKVLTRKRRRRVS